MVFWVIFSIKNPLRMYFCGHNCENKMQILADTHISVAKSICVWRLAGTLALPAALIAFHRLIWQAALGKDQAML